MIDNRPRTLLIRHFPDLAPTDLWPVEFMASVKDLKIYGIYEDVEWKISCVGCHTMVIKGNPVLGLKKYLVTADDKILSETDIDNLISEFTGKAEAIYRVIRKKNMEELKQMVMLQECYQLKKLFDAAKIDWRPTLEMTGRIKNKPLAADLLPLGKLMTDPEEYKEVFGINQFEKEVLGD